VHYCFVFIIGINSREDDGDAFTQYIALGMSVEKSPVFNLVLLRGQDMQQ